MDHYITAAAIRSLRESRGMTQQALADKIGVSAKTISKWETARGLPDISLLQPLAQALGVSLPELLNGEHIINRNTCANLLRSKFYVCKKVSIISHYLLVDIISDIFMLNMATDFLFCDSRRSV